LAIKLSFYFHTLRYLKPRQVFWRIWYKFSKPYLDYSPPPAQRPTGVCWVQPARRRKSLESQEKFNFLNKTGCLSELGWNGSQREVLWRYNQHYFDDLNSIDSELRCEWHLLLIKSWIKENAPGNGIGWDPYPTSLRIVNWIKWNQAGHSLNDDCLRSLAIQIRWLSQRIEWHLLGNHLFVNAKALVFAGVFFSGSESHKWRDIGLEIIDQELSEQVLSDGGHFERSPMYHSNFLEDILDLINLSETYPGEIDKARISEWREAARKMLSWLEEMCHPDREITFFNDAAIGIAPAPSEIKAYASRLGIFSNHPDKSFTSPTATQFPDSGYVRLDALNLVALLDVAAIGPDYLPGHAHADTLSFELSLFGKRVFVNGGTSQYGSGPIRLQERGTASHNTVVVNNENSSEVWSSFRVARRAYPMDLEITQVNNAVVVKCAHDGYMRLPGRPVHKRTWHLSDAKLIVKDKVDDNFKSAVAYYHLHPDIKINTIDPNTYSLYLSNSGQEIKIAVLNGLTSIEQSFYAPEFGIRLERACLAIQFESSNDVSVEISWDKNK
jgi:uncharacterized heparinase superfamily protein